MGFRQWSPRVLIGVSVLWMLGLFGVSVARAVIGARHLLPQHTSDDVYVVIHLIGGPWLMFAPPVLLLAARWALRAPSRPAG